MNNKFCRNCDHPADEHHEWDGLCYYYTITDKGPTICECKGFSSGAELKEIRDAFWVEFND